MARYVDSALSEGEPVLYDARVHWAVFLQPFGGLWLYALIAAGFHFVLGVNRVESILKDAASTSLLSWLEAFNPLMIIVGVFCLIVGMSLIQSIIYYFNSDFVLTDRRVMSKFGLLSRTTSEQRLSKVESIHVHQSLLGRLLNFGTVTVTGTGSSTTTFGPMVDPLACKRAIEKQLDLIKDRPERE